MNQQPFPTDTTPAQFTLQAQVAGFPLTVQVSGNAAHLQAIIQRLQAIGATPPNGNAPHSSPVARVAPVTPVAPQIAGQVNVPRCPVHRIPMKESRNAGTYFCPKSLGDGTYCDQTITN